MGSFGLHILVDNQQDTEIPAKNRNEGKSVVLDPVFLHASD